MTEILKSLDKDDACTLNGVKKDVQPYMTSPLKQTERQTDDRGGEDYSQFHKTGNVLQSFHKFALMFFRKDRLPLKSIVIDRGAVKLITM
jgi:hypothetical protein